LLLHGGRHRGGEGGDFRDDVVDLLDRLRGVGDRRLDGADLAGDLLGGLGGLPGERLHLRGDDREAAAGFAGARRLDGGVEGEQVGLAGNRLNEPDHLADTGGGLAELRHGMDGAPRIPDGAVRASAETSSAALLSCVAVTSRRRLASRTLESALSTDISNRAMVAAIASA